jgi:tRNA threonylcarbamoyladenosine biosynthesis protein TsaE
MNFITNTVEETIELGKKIGGSLNPGDIVCIDGDLGSGKTHLTKGIALGLGIDEHITSPTFNIVNEYEGRIKLYHFDVYRVNDPDEIAAIGFDEYIFSDAASVIEWSDYIKELIPDDHIQINIANESETRRSISIQFFGKRYDKIKEVLQ